MTSIRKYAAKDLSLQNIDPDRLVADAYADLGYWHFSEYDLITARQAFSASLKEKPNKRALLYWLACLLPAGIVKMLRKIKNL